jgi:hypothetical protein
MTDLELEDMIAEFDLLAVRVQSLQNENDRLREALEDLLDDSEVQDFGEWFEDRLKQASTALGVKQIDPVCVNAHDRCYGGAGGPCPYCEMPAALEVKP